MARLLRLIAGVGLVAVGIGCWSLPPAWAANGSVTIEDFTFNPSSVTVNEGDTVTWTNGDVVTHTVSADGGAFDRTLDPGQSFTLDAETPGAFPYHCSIHPEMT